MIGRAIDTEIEPGVSRQYTSHPQFAVDPIPSDRSLADGEMLYRAVREGDGASGDMADRESLADQAAQRME